MPEPAAPAAPAADGWFASALIVDDHPLCCDALALTLTGPPGIAAVEAGRTPEAALERLETGPPPDVILLDLNLPDVNGLDGVARLRQAGPHIPSSSRRSTSCVSCVPPCGPGVSGFVPKHAERETFAEAFAAIARGEVHAPSMALDAAPPSLSEEAVCRLALLTRQQARILQLVPRGSSPRTGRRRSAPPRRPQGSRSSTSRSTARGAGSGVTGGARG